MQQYKYDYDDQGAEIYGLRSANEASKITDLTPVKPRIRQKYYIVY